MLNAIIAASLQHIWSLVKSQEITVMIPFFSITLPANALAVFSFFLQIVAFEMIPCEFIYEGMENALEGIEINPRAARFESIGFEGVWIIPNLGSLLLIIGLFPLRTLVLPCMRLLAKKWPKCI